MNDAKSGDRHAFISYTDTVHRERKLLDDQETIKGEAGADDFFAHC